MSLGTVIIVDDERSMGELLVTDLRLRGYEPLAFTSAAPALEYVKSQPVDVVLTDVRMPGTGGLELCAQLSTVQPQVPVIVMTAFGSMDTAVAALRSGGL